MRSCALWVATLFSLCSLPIMAQVDPATLNGARVRLTLANHDQSSGTLVAFRADSVVLAERSSGRTQSFARTDVIHVERSAGSRRYLLRGATIGFFAGGAFGGMTISDEVNAQDGPCNGDPACDLAHGAATAGGVVSGAFMGTVVGLLVGAWSHEQWASVGGGSDVRVTLVPASGRRVALSVSLRR